MKKPTEFYVTIKTWPHVGEKAVLTTQKRLNNLKEVEVKCYLLDCEHNQHEIWLTRDDI